MSCQTAFVVPFSFWTFFNTSIFLYNYVLIKNIWSDPIKCSEEIRSIIQSCQIQRGRSDWIEYQMSMKIQIFHDIFIWQFVLRKCRLDLLVSTHNINTNWLFFLFLHCLSQKVGILKSHDIFYLWHTKYYHFISFSGYCLLSVQTAALLPTTEFVDSLEISGTGVPKSKLHCISVQAFLDLASEIQDHDLGPSM